jgi:phosphosulfolactate phosphohydrolase-like enzyme
MDIDVALVPDQASAWRHTVCIVIDEIRASSTITTLLDHGCATLFLAPSLVAARRRARETDRLVARQRRVRTPRVFDS